ncbi:hypothetical protein CWI42_060860 [Ordospora colligata]|uniref:Cullin family profile domain-containing protein n=1 Tax=Ordospora colligata OC4 TaxID=1354746 RepID=A0A0B2UES5_9MICR|nr:uncharacterized protein M896_060860 [Ordospora colligata OC4]KHN69586.1 hypothetical protein M896_060860 [Ordospora colligata OC4]TBU15406.1 hypothetical protein CWI41_060850 [Ordospora colligata]TBU15506.1 hypothetical protein CWI40_060850 [Ordospora colligata]TBU18602.1 hypothetical protein CWI42_060860 [Ordospora colligata]
MEYPEFHNLEGLTLKLLRDYRTFSSDDFMCIHNIVYNHCTEVCTTFQTRGLKIYECLKSVFSTHVDHLRCFTSLKTLHHQIDEFSSALAIVSKAYSYLERYFIRISIEKRDGHIMDIRTLGYVVFYRQYMERMMDRAKEIVFFEINVSRSSKDYVFTKLTETVRYLRMLYFCNDESEKYDEMVKQYVDMFRSSMIFDAEIGKVLKRVYLEIYIASKVFEPENNRLYKDVIFGLKSRFAEILKTMHEKMERQERLKLYVKIVQFMDSECMDGVFDQYKSVICKKMETVDRLDGLIALYINVRMHVTENFIKTYELCKYLEDEVRRCLGKLGTNTEDDACRFIEDLLIKKAKINESCNHNNCLCRYIIGMCNELKIESSIEEVIDTVIMVVGMMSNRDMVIGRINGVVQRMILGYSTEPIAVKRLMHVMKKHLGMNMSRKICVMYADYISSSRNDHDVYAQHEGFVVEALFLTRGFYDVSASGESLPSLLRDSEKMVARHKLASYPRAVFEGCYSLSPVVFEMNGFNFCMGADKVAIMMWLDIDRTKDDLRECVGGRGFKRNLEYLLSHGFVILVEEIASLNRKFSNREYEYVKSRCKRVCMMGPDYDLKDILDDNGFDGYNEEVLDLFEVEDEEGVAIDEYMEVEYCEAVLEAKVMRIMKKEKKTSIDEIIAVLSSETGCAEQAIKDAICKLEEKEYCRTDGNDVEYLP